MKLHFGCSKLFPGPLKGWENLDIAPTMKEIKKWDVTKGLPYSDNSIDAIYSCHTFEHFTKTEAQFVISECFRVLQPGGQIKIVVPDIDDIVEIYYNFEKLGNMFKIGRKFNTREEYIIFSLTQNGQHKYMYSERSLRKLLFDAGIKEIAKEENNATSHYSVFKEIADFPVISLGMSGVKQ